MLHIQQLSYGFADCGDFFSVEETTDAVHT